MKSSSKDCVASWFGRAIAAGVAGATLFSAVAAKADMPAAGLKILNTAEAIYFNTSLGMVERVFSNTVEAVVNEFPALSVDADQTVRVAPGTGSQFVYFVENIGNTPLRPELQLSQLPSDVFDLDGLRVFRDSNGNGRIDTNETEIAVGSTFDIRPGERLPFIVLFETPPGTYADGDNAEIRFGAEDASRGVADDAAGEAVTASGGLILYKSASDTHADPGGVLDYSISFRNDGGTPLLPVAELDGEPLLIDGVARSGVVFRDQVPLHSQFERLGATVTFRALFQTAAAANTQSYTTSLPSDPADVAVVAFVYDPDQNLDTSDPYPAGFSTDVGFAVRVLDNAGGLRLENTAVGYQPIAGGSVVPVDSNTVETPITGDIGEMHFTDGPFEEIVRSIPTNENAFLQVSAGVCNQDALEVGSIDIEITTEPEGDREIVQAVETGPNTGVFRTAAIPVQDQDPAVTLNSVLTGLRRTEAKARTICQGQQLETHLIINNGGFVFNSVSNEPVANAVLIVRDASGAEVARTLSDAFGFYQFAGLAPGQYRLEVQDPGGLSYPSQRHAFPGFDRTVDIQASYGLAFTVGAVSTFGIDIPLDPGGGNPITLRKSADRSEVETGGFVRYSLEIENDNSFAILNPTVQDTLPGGLLFVAGSARFEGQSLDDPAGAPGRQLDFDLAQYTLAPMSSYTLSYVVRVAPTSGEGRRTNTAVVTGYIPGLVNPVTSNVARHTIRIDNEGTVLAREGVIMGKVWLDVNGNGVQDTYSSEDILANDRMGFGQGAAMGGSPADLPLGAMQLGGALPGARVCNGEGLKDGCGGSDRQGQWFEPGIPGVRLYLEDGRSVVTDRNGMYSLAGTSPVTHVLVLDRSTLPEGLRTDALKVRDARAPGSRFVDAKAGELRSENFPIGPGSAANVARVRERIANFRGLDIADSLLRTDLPLTRAQLRPIGSTRQGELVTETQVTRQSGGGWSSNVARVLPGQAAKDVYRTVDLEQLVKELDPALGFVELRDGDVVTRDRISIRVKGPAAVGLNLEINGKTASARQVGQRAIFEAGGVQAAEFIAVDLKAGANTLRLVQTDPFGNERGSAGIVVHAPGQPDRMHVAAPANGVADPATPIPVVLRVTDSEGRLTTTPIEATLEASRGYFDVTDIRDTEIGTQIFIDRGEAVVYFVPPALAGSHRITVRSSLGTYTADIQLTPDLNQRLAAGIVEGAVKFGKSGSSLAPLMKTDQLSSFEDTVQGVRGALYLKGRVRGDALLTLRYDSDRDTKDRLFRDISPNEYYPVYGDNSERGFDARSNSELYVKVEKGLSYVLYGDVNVGAQSDAIRLGAYSRNMTGAHAHFEDGGVRVDLFAARTENNQAIREIRARGISGPYDLDLTGYVDGSEDVEIITYDRDQPEVEIKRLRLRRYTDYTLDYFDNTIIFDRPVAAVDEDLNPQVIRVTYEIDEGGKPYWVVAGEIGVDVSDNVTVGYREARSISDREFDDRRTVRSAYARVEGGRYGRLTIEGAQTENRLGERGNGYRAEYEVRNANARLRVSAGTTDGRFDAPQSSIREGRREARAQGDVKVSERIRLEGDALYSEDRLQAEKRYGAEAKARVRISEEFDVIAGGRHVVSDGIVVDGRREVTSAIAGIGVRPAALPGASIGLEYEQDVSDASHRRWLIDGGYQVSDQVRVYTRTELSSSGTGEFGLGDFRNDNLTSVAGVEVAWSDTVTSFTEHREGRAGGLANGVTWRWLFADWHTVYGKVEHVQPIASEHDMNAAVALGYTFENEGKTQLFEVQPEWNRRERGGDNWYASVAYGQRFGDLTLLAQNRLAVTGEAGNTRLRDRLRAGFAYRPVAFNDWAVLGWYGIEFDENEREDDEALIHTWAIGGEATVVPGVTMKARHAGRAQDQQYGDIDADSLVLLGTAGIEWDVAERFVLGVNGTVFADPEAGATTTGVGAEIGFVPVENVMISLGYNHAEIDEDKVRDIYQKGFYVRLKAKMDERVWDVFDDVGLSGR